MKANLNAVKISRDLVVSSHFKLTLLLKSITNFFNRKGNDTLLKQSLVDGL